MGILVILHIPINPFITPMTIKNTNGYSGKPARRVRIDTSDGSSSASTYVIDDAITSFWQKTSHSNDNFHAYVAGKDILPHQNLVYRRWDHNPSSGSVIYNSPWGTSTHHFGCFLDTNLAGSWETDPDERDECDSIQRRLDLKLLLEIKDQKMNIANLIAERDQTLELFTKTAKKLTNAIGKLRRGNLKGAAEDFAGLPSRRGQRRFNKQYADDHAKAVANAWIELQYGWKPLIAEAQGAGEALAKLALDRRTATAEAKLSVSLSHERTLDFNIKDSYRKCDTKIDCKGSVIYRVDPGWAQWLAGIGLTNPLSPAWELTPWSFIVDWFIPVGDTIAALDAVLGATFITGSRTLHITRDISTMEIYSRSGYGGFSVLNRKEIDIVRTPLFDFPGVPMMQFKSPLSWAHAANALALAVQRIR